jgi:hypothetical protein
MEGKKGFLFLLVVKSNWRHFCFGFLHVFASGLIGIMYSVIY